MSKINSQKPIGLFIESPLIIGGTKIVLSVARLELESGKNLMFHCDKQELGFAFVRAILCMQRITGGVICIKTEKKELFIDRKNNVDLSREEIRIAYVSEDGSDFCRDLTIRENLNLIGDNPDFNERVQQLAGDFLVEENLDDFPDSISINRKKIYSIIRAWVYLPDIIVYSNPLEHLDDFSSIEILKNFAIPRKESGRLNIMYVPSIGMLSNIIHNFHLVETIH